MEPAFEGKERQFWRKLRDTAPWLPRADCCHNRIVPSQKARRKSLLYERRYRFSYPMIGPIG